jgi:hypothetical protein
VVKLVLYEKPIRLPKDIEAHRDQSLQLDEATLENILRDHRLEPVEDAIERYVRSCFDAFLNFLFKLEYLCSIEMITKKELKYYRDYIDEAARRRAIRNYIRIYRIPLEGRLHTDLDYRTALEEKGTHISADRAPRTGV